MIFFCNKKKILEWHLLWNIMNIFYKTNQLIKLIESDRDNWPLTSKRDENVFKPKTAGKVDYVSLYIYENLPWFFFEKGSYITQIWGV